MDYSMFVLTMVWIAGFDSFGTRNFSGRLIGYTVFKYGFHI